MFSTRGLHGPIWPEATALMRYQRSILWPETATVHCSRRPHQFKSLKTLQLWSPYLLTHIGVGDTMTLILTDQSLWYNIIYIFLNLFIILKYTFMIYFVNVSLTILLFSGLFPVSILNYKTYKNTAVYLNKTIDRFSCINHQIKWGTVL